MILSTIYLKIIRSFLEYNGIIENELNKTRNNYNNYYIDKDDVVLKIQLENLLLNVDNCI